MNAEQGLHLRPVRMGTMRAEAETRADGTIYVRSLEQLAPYPRSMTDRLAHWAAATPDAVFLADRDESGAWRTITYGEANRLVRPLAQARQFARQRLQLRLLAHDHLVEAVDQVLGEAGLDFEVGEAPLDVVHVIHGAIGCHFLAPWCPCAGRLAGLTGPGRR